MFSFLALSASILAVQAAPNFPNFPAVADIPLYLRGFQNPKVVPSVAGHATCVQGNIPVSTSAMNYELKYTGPANQSVLTETLVEFLQQDATLPTNTLGPKTNVSGTYNINSQICWPATGAINASLVQFLTHGVGFDKSYWNFFSNDYSYADRAALAGYTTFFYDRLGVGQSDHPDPIQVVQAPLEINIAHGLIEMLRCGSISSTKFEHVIGVGHSLGSELTNALTAQYPKDLDAAVLTGFSVESSGFPSFFSGLNLALANQNQPQRFTNLPNGYAVSDSLISNQFGFLRLPNFDYDVLLAAEATKGTFTIGELFTNSMFVSPAPQFTGPIDVVDGENDLPFCQSNCLAPTNKAAEVKGALYPAASAGSQYYIAKGAGHGLNLHFVAPQAYQHIFSFIAANGF